MPTRFALEALQANDGDCLLLHFEPSGASPVRVLIDGGSRDVYRTVIKPRIDQLLGGQPRLDLRMVMVSHIDADHITGILDLFKTLSELQDDGAEPFCRIRTLWHNAFGQVHANTPASVDSGAVSASLEGRPIPGLDEFAGAVIASVPQGNRLRDYATHLTVPINQGAAPLVLAPEHGQLKVDVADGLTFTVLAPHQAQLNRLQAEWNSAKAAHPADPTAQAADYLNNTVPNMSSIVVLAEAVVAPGVRKRMLLTGDARGDVILEALDAAGLSENGRSHFDLLKVQHHASSHSTTQDFFERVTADRYVICGNGKMGNPHPDAMRWLSNARHGQPFDAYLTNRTGLNDLGAMFDRFLADEAKNEPAHVYHFRRDSELSIAVDLTA